MLETLEANVPETIMAKFEMVLHLREILVVFVLDVLRDAHRRGR